MTADLSTQTVVVRAYRATDREVVREICRQTAFRNLGSAAVFEDGELFADYWTKYYTDFEAESCLLLEENGVVVGYLLGCVDSLRFASVMARSILPGLLARLLWRCLCGRYHQRHSRRMVSWLLFRSWREAPPVPRKRFPAHYHCNILPRGYGKRFYSLLVLSFLDRLEQLGITGLHGQVEEPANRGGWLRMVSGCLGSSTCAHQLEHYSERMSSFQRVVLDKPEPQVNRVWGAQLSAYRYWILWLRERYRL